MIVYTIFDTTIPSDYKLLLSSSKVDDIYNKAKSFLEIDIDYNTFLANHKMKSSGQHVYESDKNFKSVMTLITVRN